MVKMGKQSFIYLFIYFKEAASVNRKDTLSFYLVCSWNFMSCSGIQTLGRTFKILRMHWDEKKEELKEL